MPPTAESDPAAGHHAVPDSHCPHCGGRFPANAGWPRTCPRCGRVRYRNPLPVAVALQPVLLPAGDPALLVIRRDIEPRRGLLALPGGFVDHGEDWRGAVVRELFEETRVRAPADRVRLFDVMGADGDHLLVFGLLPPLAVAELPPDLPTEETTGRELLTGPRELAFPLHTRAAWAWFAGHAPPRVR
ncbi:NUDIX domain-containing protein [Streptomyces calidiresistens]|uniref:NUDIX domain-containing protein n=1 Tax=Streptomyces calidiresistens TaxID=1485586 RepID=A0A7W3T673_9ACTN|nr:NUDIX domain-containing protein [Streptomyces calidiresistens]MBB0231679.1 NUDIX domain-containing protein [Streptomyces calidiresistens]